MKCNPCAPQESNSEIFGLLPLKTEVYSISYVGRRHQRVLLPALWMGPLQCQQQLGTGTSLFGTLPGSLNARSRLLQVSPPSMARRSARPTAALLTWHCQPASAPTASTASTLTVDELQYPCITSRCVAPERACSRKRGLCPRASRHRRAPRASPTASQHGA